MPEINLSIPGPPIAQSRPRTRRIGRFISIYDPNMNDKKALSNYAKTVLPHDFQLITSPISIEIFFYLLLPNSWSNKKKYRYNITPHSSKPDLDNLLKYILDALNGIVYNDDSQIYQIITKKMYSSEPKTVVIIKYEL